MKRNEPKLSPAQEAAIDAASLVPAEGATKWLSWIRHCDGQRAILEYTGDAEAAIQALQASWDAEGIPTNCGFIVGPSKEVAEIANESWDPISYWSKKKARKIR